MTTNHPLPVGTSVAFDIAQGLSTGLGTIREAVYDDGWLYRLDPVVGNRLGRHRHQDGAFWVCEFEVEVVDMRT